MRPATISWPAATLGCPLRSPYSVDAPSMFEASTQGREPANFRLVRTEERRTFSCEFIWTAAQMTAFLDFFETTLRGGMLAFSMEHLGDGRMVPMHCQMDGGWEATPHRELFGRWAVTMRIVGWWRAVASPDWA